MPHAFVSQTKILSIARSSDIVYAAAMEKSNNSLYEFIILYKVKACKAVKNISCKAFFWAGALLQPTWKSPATLLKLITDSKVAR
jgi:hypothetical protein